MANTLRGYLAHTSHEVHHARELSLHAKPDIEWMHHLSSTGDEWLVVSGDGRISRNKAERAAYRRAGLRGVVLAPAYQKTPMGRCCGILVAKWDGLLDFINSIEPPYLVEMSINLTPRYKVLPL